MKRVILLLLINCYCFSCIRPTASKGRIADFKTLDTTLNFAGMWVNETYVDMIRHTRFPRHFEAWDMLSCFIVPGRTLQASSMIYGFHDGVPFVVVKDGSRYKTYDPQLTVCMDSFVLISSHRIKISRQYFVRLPHYNSSLSDQGILEELLFHGRYQSANGGDVVFEDKAIVQLP
ncbi:hypothetical protein ACDQ55_12500 [Chitinophaga sp. 30R24]|uniref:hypothetical protein n=1 Tax=Chitinophaga sp. 30R24 TaxID=3248838 RepID=UPI003B9108DD